MKDQPPYLLPEAMTPTDYAYIVLGKAPNRTSIFSSVKAGRIPSVEVEVSYSNKDTGQVYKTVVQNWVKVPESERTINKQYQRNVAAIQSKASRKPWEWLLQIDASTLPDCPKLQKWKQIEQLVVAVREYLFPVLLKLDPMTKPKIISTFERSFPIQYKEVGEANLNRVIGWYIRNGYLELTGESLPEDKRQSILQVTDFGKQHGKEILHIEL